MGKKKKYILIWRRQLCDFVFNLSNLDGQTNAHLAHPAPTPQLYQIVKQFPEWHEFLSSLQSSCRFVVFTIKNCYFIIIFIQLSCSTNPTTNSEKMNSEFSSVFMSFLFCCFYNQELLLWYHFIIIIMFIDFNNQFWKKRILNLLSIFMSFPLVLLFLWSRIITLISFHTIIIFTESNNNSEKKEFWFFPPSFHFISVLSFFTNKNYYFDIIS